VVIKNGKPFDPAYNGKLLDLDNGISPHVQAERSIDTGGSRDFVTIDLFIGRMGGFQ
jgi:hypothetical protein